MVESVPVHLRIAPPRSETKVSQGDITCQSKWKILFWQYGIMKKLINKIK